MVQNSFLVICETFYSIQGEGKSSGMPAIFLRLAGCNLRCNGFSYQDPDTKEHLGCDSKQVWQRGERSDFASIIADWERAGWLQKLAQGAHLVITGGEPLLQKPALAAFLQYLDNALSCKVFVEIETNGTLSAGDFLLQRINQFNVSPKLAHSGEPLQKAFQSDVIAQFVACEKANFKFVLAKQADVDELIIRYVQPFAIQRQRVWLMPEGGTREAVNAKKGWIVDLCKQHGFNFSSRLQVDIWGEVVGV